MSFPRYEKYKDSGVKWLGEIPELWTVQRAKRIFREVSEKNYPDAQLLSVTQHQGVVPRESLEQRVVMPVGQLQTFKLVRKDDFVISLRSFQGGIEYSAYEGLVSPAYTVLRKREDVDSGYLKHLLKSSSFIDELNMSVTGIRQGKNIDFGDFSYSFIPLPEAEDQKKIAGFLDKKTVEIDEAITKKQKLIELLEEQKAIIINQAVTKGPNPDAPMKDSGVEWIGEIPAHWVVKRAKYLFDEIDERSKTGQEELLSVSHMTGVTPRSEKKIMMFMAEDYTGSKLCKSGDLVINIMWAWMGALGVSGQTGIVSPSYGVFRPKKDRSFNSWFLEHLLRSRGYVAEYNRRSTGLHSSRLRLYADYFFDMEIGFPSVDEQNQIESELSERTQDIDRALLAIEKEIEAITELKATLISHAVTGKIRIPEVYKPFFEPETETTAHYKAVTVYAKLLYDLRMEPTMGAVKGQKLLYLWEAHFGETFDSNYSRKAAGPHDPSMWSRVHESLAEKKWFTKVERQGLVKGYKYNKGSRCSECRAEYERVHGSNPEHDDFIKLFRDKGTDFCERVATLYAAWNDLLLWGKPSDKEKVLAEINEYWPGKKEKFHRKDWVDALTWMKRNCIVPKGTGKPTRQLTMMEM